MKPTNRLSLWSLIVLLILSPIHVVSAQDSKKVARYQAEMAKIYASVSVRPVELDRSVVKSGERLKATAVLENTSALDFVIPPVPGTTADSVLGNEDWYIRRLDGGKKGERVRRHGLILRVPELKAGEKVPLKFTAGEVDPKVENLASGKYEISVDFISTANRVVGSSSAVFEVVNPDFVDPAVLARKRKLDAGKLETYGKEIFAKLKLADMTVSNSTVKRGVAVEATCELVNMTKADVVLPDDPVFRNIGNPDAYSKRNAVIGMYQWMVEKGGATVSGAGGSVFTMPADGVFPAGYKMPMNNSIETRDLPPGQYELTLTVRDCGHKVVGVKKQRFRVIN